MGGAGHPLRVDPYKLRFWRVDRLMTIGSLSEKSGVSYTTIWFLEQEGYHDSARMTTIAKLANALDVPAKDILRDDANRLRSLSHGK